ncbi:WAS/WASL-interacting protein family member 1-like [Delphinapterus leucas]|uniref:WAS/WASL-interacting protein family member 1-like n=1 Tax=Delphinapterus leucas TaxID=9749 RepID=A0A7F8K761_DELLE|nr:WAS/WASL-interacting protein family member 1-like [Delphinapterus leucas]
MTIPGGLLGAQAEGGEGEGESAGGGGTGGGGAGARGLCATFLQTTLPHAEGTEISGALEGIAGGRAGGCRGTTQVSPRPRPNWGRGRRRQPRSPHPRSARWLSPIPHFPPLNPGAPSSSPPPPPQPPAAWSCCTFPSPGAPQPPRCTPNPFAASPPLGGKKRKPDEPKRGAAGVGARRKGEGEGTYFSRRGAERCRREIKARIRAAWKPADAVVSALQSRRLWRWRPQGTGTGARAAGAARLGSAGARAALQLGPRLRADPLLAPLWLLAPTPGSHMTPAPLALRASQGWRGENTLRTEAVLCVTVFPVPGHRRPPLSRRTWLHLSSE